MLELMLPGHGRLLLEHLVLDYNGTLACDGKLLKGVAQRLRDLSKKLCVHVITADTFGQAAAQLGSLPCKLTIFSNEAMDASKLAYITQLGPAKCVCIGNGRNDRLMLKASALGIVVIQEEGAAIDSLLAAQAVTTDIKAALDLLRKPLRLTATLRV